MAKKRDDKKDDLPRGGVPVESWKDFPMTEENRKKYEEEDRKKTGNQESKQKNEEVNS